MLPAPPRRSLFWEERRLVRECAEVDQARVVSLSCNFSPPLVTLTVTISPPAGSTLAPTQLILVPKGRTVEDVQLGDLNISPSVLAPATIRKHFSQTLVAKGGKSPYHWSIVEGSLPAGLRLSTAGVISGTPTTAGTRVFGVRVLDSTKPQLSGTQYLSLTVNIVVATVSLRLATLGKHYTAGLSATGGESPYAWRIASGVLPPGLSLSGSGAIAGTPTASGTYKFTVAVNDASTPPLTASKALSLTVAK